jgi:hypothetical protein
MPLGMQFDLRGKAMFDGASDGATGKKKRVRSQKHGQR